MVSKKQLGAGETVVLAMRQHVKALLVPILVFFVVCGAAGVLVAVLPGGDDTLWVRFGIVAAVAILVALRFSVWPFLNWLTSTYTVTTERILTSQGVFHQYGRTMPLSRVNDVAFDRGVLDRMLGCGTLVVSSAGELGQLQLTDVPKVESVQRKIYELVEAEHDRARAVGGGLPFEADDHLR